MNPDVYLDFIDYRRQPNLKEENKTAVMNSIAIELSIESIYSFVDKSLSEENLSLRESGLRARGSRPTLGLASEIQEFLSTSPYIDKHEDFLVNQNVTDTVPVYVILEKKIDQSYTYTICAVSLFTIGYSTWKGRVVNLDFFLAHDHENTMMQCLIKISRSLNCARIVYQSSRENDVQMFRDKIGAEVLPDWLTLRMGNHEMESFTATKMSWGAHTSTEQKEHEHTKPNTESFDAKQVIETVLSKFRNDQHALKLRRASGDDSNTIFNLVKGLALYEKAADQVSINPSIYQRDGGGVNPIFHCVLVESCKNGGDPSVVGMAFFYFGLSASSGKYLYLEDLFIKEDFRGLGCGKTIMSCLAEISLKLNCNNFIWQALDWNTPALSFYKMIGAKVCRGLVTTRLNKDMIDR